MRMLTRRTAAGLPWRALCLLLLAAWLLPCGAAQATAPSDVKCSYDSVSQTLQVTITHASPFPNSHYIKGVEVRKNGQTVVSQSYKSQPPAPAFAYSYHVPASPGDVLEVKVNCSLWGSKAVTFTVPGR